MKELYIRKGNSVDLKNIIIIGEEQSLGDRDLSGYRPSKGTCLKCIKNTDPYSKNTGLTYIHATPNIKLDTDKYSRDYDVHNFVKQYCTDIVKWDGETNDGIVRSREAFICKNKNVDKTAWELYKRIETEIHGGNICLHIFLKRFFKVLFFPIRIVLKLVWWIVKVCIFILLAIFLPRRNQKKLFRFLFK